MRVPSPTALKGKAREAKPAPTPITPPSALAGKSILDLLWQELDSIMDDLLDQDTPTDEWDKGRATGVAYAISLIQNPYLSNVDEVRQEAKRRWQARQANEPMPALRTRP